jgi:hypothetical protein
VSREVDGLWNNLPVAYLLASNALEWKQAGCDHHRAFRTSSTTTSIPMDSAIQRYAVFCPDCGLKKFETYAQAVQNGFHAPLMRPGLAA